MFRSLQAELQILSLAADNLNMNERGPVVGVIRQQVFDYIGENACAALMFVGNPEKFPVKQNKCFCSLPYCGGYVIVDAEIKIHILQI